jgi:hypothetical protein
MEKQWGKEKLILDGMMVAYGFSVSAVGALLPVFLREFSLSAVLGGAVAGPRGWEASRRPSWAAPSPTGSGSSAPDYHVRSLLGLPRGSRPDRSYSALLAVFFSIGFTTRLVDTLANARVSDISGADRPRRLALLPRRLRNRRPARSPVLPMAFRASVLEALDRRPGFGFRRLDGVVLLRGGPPDSGRGAPGTAVRSRGPALPLRDAPCGSSWARWPCTACTSRA